MDRYTEKMVEVFKEMEKQLERKKMFEQVLQTLKVGDTVYEEGSYDDIFPQIIIEIDMENLQIYTHEVSINKYKWRQSLSLFDEVSKKYVAYY